MESHGVRVYHRVSVKKRALLDWFIKHCLHWGLSYLFFVWLDFIYLFVELFCYNEDVWRSSQKLF
jgi:hypothetical protein